jgi:hypothetical protein
LFPSIKKREVLLLITNEQCNFEISTSRLCNQYHNSFEYCSSVFHCVLTRSVNTSRRPSSPSSMSRLLLLSEQLHVLVQLTIIKCANFRANWCPLVTHCTSRFIVLKYCLKEASIAQHREQTYTPTKYAHAGPQHVKATKFVM